MYGNLFLTIPEKTRFKKAKNSIFIKNNNISFIILKRLVLDIFNIKYNFLRYHVTWSTDFLFTVVYVMHVV